MYTVQFETTIERPVEASGVGLHTGVPVKLRMVPAPAGTGIVFRRSDLDYFPIPASWKYVERVSYATSLMRPGVLISTTEHLLSTLYSFGIDNVWLEIDNLEVPILDGSGKPWVDLLRQAGVRQLRRKRRYLRIRRPVVVEDGPKRISILPDNAAESLARLISLSLSENNPLKWKSRRKIMPLNYLRPERSVSNMNWTSFGIWD